MTLNNYKISCPLNYYDAENTPKSHIDTKFGLILKKDFDKVGQVIFTGHYTKGVRLLEDNFRPIKG